MVSVTSWNVRGLLGHTFNKLDDVDFKRLAINADINIHVETWSNGIFRYDLNDYICYCIHRKKKNKKDKCSGGICIYIKSSTDEHVNLYDDGGSESFIILECDGSLFNLNCKVYIFACYFPPISPKCYVPKVPPFIDLRKKMDDILLKCNDECAFLIVC